MQHRLSQVPASVQLICIASFPTCLPFDCLALMIAFQSHCSAGPLTQTTRPPSFFSNCRYATCTLSLPTAACAHRLSLVPLICLPSCRTAAARGMACKLLRSMLKSAVSAVVKIGAACPRVQNGADGQAASCCCGACGWCNEALAAARGWDEAGRSVAAANLQPALAHQGGVGAQPLGVLAAGRAVGADAFQNGMQRVRVGVVQN